MLQVLVNEYARRGLKENNFAKLMLPHSRELHNHPSLKKAVLATRRSGKSYNAGGLSTIDTCYKNPYCNTLIMGLTRASIKGIYWKDIFKDIKLKNNLDMVFKESTLTIEYPNGATTYLLGMDANEDDIHKVLGQKFKKVVIDEAASFRRDLKGMVEKFIEPATIDCNGEIIMIGTPQPFCAGYFYDVTNGIEPGWENRFWNALDNPHVAKNWQKKIDTLIAHNPDVINQPFFKMMYLGEWVTDIANQVFPYSDKNYVDEMPDIDFCVVAVDIGYQDSDSISVLGWRKHDKNLYIHKSVKKNKQNVFQLACMIKAVEKEYAGKIVKRVIDAGALGKKITDELNTRYKLAYEAAEKTRKLEYIHLMNADIQSGFIKILKGSDTDNDAKKLIWDKEKDWEIDDRFHSDILDSDLYGWRESLHFFQRDKEIHLINDPDWGDRFFEKEIKEQEMKEAGYIDDVEEDFY